MKLLEQGIDRFQRGAQGEAKGYRVEQNSKVMDIFSNMLYNDKIAAPIRELATNAWDAHVMAGTTDKVPVVTLPSSKKCEYSIRDFGTGLSKDDMENMYQTYGHSTKNHSNDFNGCMGIGSKSPFAYTRSFTTTSYQNGMKYVYINAKDEHNMPNLQLFFEGPTDEPNGLEVSFAVERGDISSFASKAKEILQWFPQKFEVKGGDYIYKWEWPKYTHKMKGDNWRIRGDSSKSVAIMGYIQYPIESKHFTEKKATSATDDVSWYTHGSHDDPTDYVQLLNLGLEMDFGIGEIEMSASREGLQYTPATINHIKRRLDVILKEIKDKVASHLLTAECMWDAEIVYNELVNGTLAGIKTLINVTKPEWNGKRLGGERINQTNIELYGITSRSFHRSNPRGGVLASPKMEANYHYIAPSTKNRLYVADMDRGNDVVVKWAMRDDQRCRAYVYRCPDMTALTHLIDTLGITNKHLIYTSTLEKPPKEVRDRVKNDKVFTFKDAPHVYSSTDYQNKYWEAAEIDFNKGGLYVELNNWMVFDPETDAAFGRADTIHDVIAVLNEFGIRVPQIVGAKTAVVQRYNKVKQWTNFFVWARKKIEQYVKKINVQKYMDAIATYNSFGASDFYTEVSQLSRAKLTNPKNLFAQFLDKLAEYSTIVDTWSTKLSKIKGVCDRFKIVYGNSATTSVLYDLERQCKDRYGFITLIDQSRWAWVDDRDKQKRCDILVDTINKFDAVGL